MRPLALALLVFAVGAAAQEVAPGPIETLYDRGGVAVAGPSRTFAEVEARRTPGPVTRVVTRGAAATFEVDYSAGFSDEAQAAFQYAVDIWAQHLDSPVPIRVAADFSDLEEGVLGSAGPRVIRFSASPPPGLVADTWYPFALADAAAGTNLASDGDNFYDITAQFSSARTDFYFGLDGDPPAGQFDFVTIVLHELGHGLGFLGSGEVDDGADEVECNGVNGVGCWGYFGGEFSGFPFAFDRTLVDAAGVAMLNEAVYPNPSLALGALLQSQALFVDTPTVVDVFGGLAPVWAPVEFEPGSSFSHWDETVVTGTSAALMTPQVARGEAYQDPGDLTCAFFLDIGWDLGAGCTALVEGGGPIDPPPPPPPPVDVLTVDLIGPNPFSVATTVRIRQPESGSITALLFDAVGRRVAVLLDGEAETTERVRLAAADLAAGAYFVYVRSGEEEATLGVTVVR